jgi:hypothetical protein
MWGQSGKNRARRPAERKDHCSARILSTNRRVGFPDDNIGTKPSYSEHPKATDSNLGAHTYAGNAEGKVIVSIHSSQELPIICICVFSGNSLAWYWYASDCQHQVRWIFYSEDPKSFMEKRLIALSSVEFSERSDASEDRFVSVQLRLLRTVRLARCGAPLHCVCFACQRHCYRSHSTFLGCQLESGARS